MMCKEDFDKITKHRLREKKNPKDLFKRLKSLSENPPIFHNTDKRLESIESSIDALNKRLDKIEIDLTPTIEKVTESKVDEIEDAKKVINDMQSTWEIEKYLGNYIWWKELLVKAADDLPKSDSLMRMLSNRGTKLALIVCGYKQLEEWNKNSNLIHNDDLYNEALKNLYDIHKYLYEMKDVDMYVGKYFQYEKLKNPENCELLLFKKLFNENKSDDLKPLDINFSNVDRKYYPAEYAHLETSVTTNDKNKIITFDEKATDKQVLWEEMKNAVTTGDFRTWKQCLFSLERALAEQIHDSENVFNCIRDCWFEVKKSGEGLTKDATDTVLYDLFKLNHKMLFNSLCELSVVKSTYFEVFYSDNAFRCPDLPTEKLFAYIDEHKLMFTYSELDAEIREMFEQKNYSMWLDIIQKRVRENDPLDELYKAGYYRYFYNESTGFSFFSKAFQKFEKDLGKYFTRVMKKDLFDLHKIAFEDNFERPSYLSLNFVYNDGEIELLEEEKKCDEKCDTCSCSVIAEDCCPYDENEIRERHEKKVTVADLFKILNLKTIYEIRIEEKGVDACLYTSKDFEKVRKIYAFKKVVNFVVHEKEDMLPNMLTLEITLGD